MGFKKVAGTGGTGPGGSLGGDSGRKRGGTGGDGEKSGGSSGELKQGTN